VRCIEFGLDVFSLLNVYQLILIPILFGCQKVALLPRVFPPLVDNNCRGCSGCGVQWWLDGMLTWRGVAWMQVGVGSHIMSNPSFWFIIIVVNLCTTGHRILLYCVIWAYYPRDTQILSEKERLYGAFHEVGWQSINRLLKIGAEVPEQVAKRQSALRFSRVPSSPPVSRHIAASFANGIAISKLIFSEVSFRRPQTGI
jgi:hypothetical protein